MVVVRFSAPTSATQTKPEGIERGDDAVRADLEHRMLDQAFEDGWGEVDATELPSFRPLSRGRPSPHRTAHTLASPPLAETNYGLEPVPFSRARAVSAAQAPLQATAPPTPSRREHGYRRSSQRSPRPFLLVCFFVAGAVCGLGGAYVPGAERIIEGTIGDARTTLFAIVAAVWGLL
jgi:hypothetical protein